ncbi:hypothetical protein GWI33_006792 [Rhynchophorus ferrugineus]|uniref:Uncharacterized protein n=1 Tax=Rhynchophorus ferrugineus TaxID=354439 RepID=A0A834MDH1_RHYFE|nr:hypothetical protein GWI33_006792 [Rhynchophorus ferrugineus]
MLCRYEYLKCFSFKDPGKGTGYQSKPLCQDHASGPTLRYEKIPCVFHLSPENLDLIKSGPTVAGSSERGTLSQIAGARASPEAGFWGDRRVRPAVSLQSAASTSMF